MKDLGQKMQNLGQRWQASDPLQQCGEGAGCRAHFPSGVCSCARSEQGIPFSIHLSFLAGNDSEVFLQL